MTDIIDLLIEKCFPQGVSSEKRANIEKFFIEKIYNEYNKYYMDRELVIKNRIDALNLVLPNAKVREEYSQLIKIDDSDICEYWLEGLEDTGLQAELEIILNPTEEKLIPEDNCVSESAISSNEDNAPSKTTYSTDLNKVTEVEKTDAQILSDTRVVGTNVQGILVKGSPSKAGDYDITLKYKYQNWSEGDRILERKLKVTVNPDPRSLWQEIPTNENIKFFKEDYAYDYITVATNEKGPQKNIVAASKRGRSHAHEGKARDDDFKIFHNNDNGWYIMAVADGAGSAKYSRKGSAVACETCVEFCKTALDNPIELEKEITALNNTTEGQSNRTISTLIYDIVGRAAHKAHKAILETANANEDKLHDYSTTLLLAICKKFDFGWFIASFWVGDGAMCIYNKEDQYIRLLGTPDGGEYAGQTRFLTMQEIFTPESIMSRLKYYIEKDFTALLLMTDGISDPFFETDANLNKIDKWNELWDNINSKVDLTDDNTESQYQLLQWLDFWSPGNHDDRTIAILYKKWKI